MRAHLAIILALFLGLVLTNAEEEENLDDEESFLQVTLGAKRRPYSTDRSSNLYYRQTLDNHADVQYTGQVVLGGQSLSGFLDTGSFEIVVFSKQCSACGEAGIQGYNHSLSSSYEEGRLWQTHEYGSGSAESYDARDVLAIGPFTVEDQDFWEARNASMRILKTATFQAIVGLGPPGAPQEEARLLIQRANTHLSGRFTPEEVKEKAREDLAVADIMLRKRDSLLLNLGVRYFSVCLELASGAPGHLVWNDLPPSERAVPFASHNVLEGIEWSLNIVGARFEGPEGTIDLGCAQGCEAVVDTGTSFVAVPTTVYLAALLQLEKLDADCSNMAQMPNLIFSLGGHEYSLPPQSYVGKIRGSMPAETKAWFHHGRRPKEGVDTFHNCELLLMDSGNFLESEFFAPSWIIGMPFFRYYYTTFDLGSDPLDAKSRKIWTARASPDCQPAAPEEHSHNLNFVRTQSLLTIDGSKIRVPGRRPRREHNGSKLYFHQMAPTVLHHWGPAGPVLSAQGQARAAQVHRRQEGRR